MLQIISAAVYWSVVSRMRLGGSSATWACQLVLLVMIQSSEGKNSHLAANWFSAEDFGTVVSTYKTTLDV